MEKFKKYISFLLIAPIFILELIKNTMFYFLIMGIVVLFSLIADKFLKIEKWYYGFKN